MRLYSEFPDGFRLLTPPSEYRRESAIDRFRFGLFSRATWMRILRDAGFRPKRVRAVDGRDAFIGLRSK